MKQHMFILILIIFSSSSLPLQLFVASAAYGVSDTLTLLSVKYGGRRNGQSSSGSANDKMATYINGSAGGNFVPVATTDYATTSSLCRTSLLSIGGTSSIVGQVPVQDGYTLIGYKGSNKPADIPKEQGLTSTVVTITWINPACEQGLCFVLPSGYSTSGCSTCIQGFHLQDGANSGQGRHALRALQRQRTACHC